MYDSSETLSGHARRRVGRQAGKKSRERKRALRISDIEWDEGNTLHLELGHGIACEEAEEVFANRPLFRRTKKGHYVALGPTLAGRYLTIVFEFKAKGLARPITGWDMKRMEIRYYKIQKSRRSKK